jgi:cell division protein FtsA
VQRRAPVAAQRQEVKVFDGDLQLMVAILTAASGGGAQMKHIAQLFEYVTGFDTRIGYPNEHLANGNSEEVTSPMYATGVGLVIKGFQKLDKQKEQDSSEFVAHGTNNAQRGGFLDKLVKKTQDFFDED